MTLKNILLVFFLLFTLCSAGQTRPKEPDYPLVAYITENYPQLTYLKQSPYGYVLKHYISDSKDTTIKYECGARFRYLSDSLIKGEVLNKRQRVVNVAYNKLTPSGGFDPTNKNGVRIHFPRTQNTDTLDVSISDKKRIVIHRSFFWNEKQDTTLAYAHKITYDSIGREVEKTGTSNLFEKPVFYSTWMRKASDLDSSANAGIEQYEYISANQIKKTVITRRPNGDTVDYEVLYEYFYYPDGLMKSMKHTIFHIGKIEEVTSETRLYYKNGICIKAENWLRGELQDFTVVEFLKEPLHKKGSRVK